MRYIILDESEERVTVLDKHDNLVKEYVPKIFAYLSLRRNILPVFAPPFKDLIRQVSTGQVTNEEFLEQFLKEALIDE